MVFESEVANLHKKTKSNEYNFSGPQKKEDELVICILKRRDKIVLQCNI